MLMVLKSVFSATEGLKVGNKHGRDTERWGHVVNKCRHLPSGSKDEKLPDLSLL